jgi:hypothetical protein
MKKFISILTIITMGACVVLPGTASAFSENDARQCFLDGMEESRQAATLQTFINQRIHVPTVASRVGWHAWRVRWNDLSRDHQSFLIESVHQWLNEPSTLSEIDPDAVQLQRYIKPMGGYFEISGDIHFTDASPDFFTFLIADGCLIIGGSWNNITMKGAIAHRLPRNPP